MTKVRKLKRSKKYQYNRNRKRMNKKRLPVLESDTVKQVWNPRRSSKRNFTNLGLVFDINEDIKHMNGRSIGMKERSSAKTSNSMSVIEELERRAKAIMPEKNHKFSQDQINWITYLLDKYGDDYKAMSRDKKNYLQFTWKQIRYKIKSFRSTRVHFNEYLKNKKLK